MSAISLEKEHLVTIYNHAESGYPNECCGLLLGTVNGELKIVVEVWPTENAWSTEAVQHWSEAQELTEQRRYAIPPEILLKAMKVGRDRSLEILGIYHSHPECPAIPSECDRTYAWPQYSYIIVSLQRGKVQDIRNWVLDSEGNFRPEEILISDVK